MEPVSLLPAASSSCCSFQVPRAVHQVRHLLSTFCRGLWGGRSELYVETADYPGLLLEIVKELKDLSIDVESAEIDTEVRTLLFRML